jgi:hypothetical protein
MKTFIAAAKRSKFFLIDDLTPIERMYLLRSLTRITLNYKIKGNIVMFNHVMKLHVN